MIGQMANRVKVLYFGQARDASGTTGEEISLPAPASLHDLVRIAETRHRALTKLNKTTRMAVNAELARNDRGLDDGDEVAFLPPVAGG